jgi:hypothetical protein
MKILHPVVLHKEGTWVIDLTWLKEVDVESLTMVENDSQVVFTVINYFSKYAWVRIIPNKYAKIVSDVFRKIFAGEHCLVIQSDNSSEFKSNEFRAVTIEFEIKHIFSDTYNPCQNTMIKRFNKTLKMATKINNKDLQKIVTNYNNTLYTCKIYAGDNITTIKNARSKIKARVVKLLSPLVNCSSSSLTVLLTCSLGNFLLFLERHIPSRNLAI